MAKYENNYIEKLNRQLQDAQTRLEILTEYVQNWKEVSRYGVEEGFIKLILGIPVAEEKEEDDHAE